MSVTVAGAMLLAVLGGLFGLGGFFAVVIGDDIIPFDAASLAVTILAVVALVASVAVRDQPLYAAIGTILAPAGYLLAYGGSWGAWWSKYQDAIATSGAAENAFWTAMPAMALFAISGVVLVLATALAAYQALRRNE
jgi:hypothetical protein